MNRFVHTLKMSGLACYRPTLAWSAANRHCYAHYREWLTATHCAQITVKRYTAAAHWVFSLIEKPYWTITLDGEQSDIARVQQYFDENIPNDGGRRKYTLGLARFSDFLRIKCHTPRPPRSIHWSYHLAGVPAAMAADIQSLIAHWRGQWPESKRHERTIDTLCPIGRTLRRMLQLGSLSCWRDVTPKLWWRYSEVRLTENISARTLNIDLHKLQSCVRHAMELGEPVSEQFLRLKSLKQPQMLHRDVPLDAIKRLLQPAQLQAQSQHVNQSRLGKMDCAWILLMLHCGLRTGEIRRLQLDHVDWDRRFVRIEQSKGLKDRLVPLSTPVIAALRAFVLIRGPADALPPELFVFQHKPLSRSFARVRLNFHKTHTVAHITPHQLRHTCATLLLNSGAPVTTVKLILGHVHIDSTMKYARTYDGTLAADYHRAMMSVERLLDLAPGATAADVSPALIIAMLDSLKTSGTLNAQQQDTIATARAGMLRLTSAGIGSAAL